MTMMIAVTAVTAAYSAYTTYQDYQNQNALMDYNADMEKYNADILEMKAVDAEERGKIQERMEIMKAANAAGVHKTTEAGGGEGGAEIGVGSRYDSVEDIQVNGKLMGQLAMRNAQMDAWDIRNKATAHRTRAKMFKSQKASSFDVVLGTTMAGVGSFSGSGGLEDTTNWWEGRKEAAGSSVATGALTVNA